MSFLSIPTELRNLLAGSELEAATLDVAEKAGKILDANDLQFFPAYTDHGTQHVNQVLDAIVLLIPDEVLEKGLLSAADASVLICGALFHDLALHMHDQGFVQLVSGETAHAPLRWFDLEQVGRPPDLPWPTLWANFQAEAQHFGTSQLELMLGPVGDRVPRVAYEDPLRPERWVQGDRLLIGEFLRRHHGRLSHEIAIYGFPGAPAEEFPVLKKTMPGLANAIGVVARSHQEPLRRMLEYLAYWEPGTETPGGAFLPYSMALLRIADYFQIDAERAPPLLLRLKAPLSPRSIEQWDQHRAILGISSRHDDLFAVHIRVSPEHGLRTHLALEALFEDMQQELDTATAVLSEKYAKTELAPLHLTKQRIRTNLDTASMHAQLPYVPRRASLQSDTDLFRLVINDLYGNRPAVAGRELIQNAVDAVRARRSLEERSAHLLLPGEVKELEADIVVSIEKGEGDQLVLRIADRGIGMTPETVIDSYLQAGASFRPTAAERATDGSAGEEPLRAGRFGIGAFAGFLLGPEIKVTTRHPESEKGLSFAARIDEDLVRLDWVDALVGTEVEIAFDPEEIFTHTRHVTNSVGAFLEEIASFYRLADPEVVFIDRSDPDRPTSLAPVADHPGATGDLPHLWRRIECEDFDDVTWHPQSGDVGRLSHNGILIQDPDFPAVPTYSWSDPKLQAFLTRPPVSIYDSRHTLGINLQRYGLTEQTLPFERQLVESIGADLVAYSLTFPLDASRYPLQARAGDSPIFTETGWMPALPPLVQHYSPGRGPVLVLWLFPFFLPETYLSAIRTKGTPFWKTFPLRMRVMTEPNISPTVNALEKALLAVEQNAERWAELFGATELTSIVAPGESAEEVVQLQRGEEFELVGEGWRAIYTGRKGPDPHTYVRKTGNAAAEVERDLLTLSNDFLSDARWPLVALSVFECSTVEPSPLEPLAAPWIRTIGGDLSRNRADTLEAREAAMNVDPELRFLVEGWERTSAAGLATQ